MTQSKLYLRSLFIIILLTGLVGIAILPSFDSARAASPMQAATTVVISQLRTRGPNGASDEFIEIFNATNAPVNIGGWTLRKSSSCGFTVATLLTLNSVTLAAGQHYLVANASSTLAFDQSYPSTTTLADDGGIALFDNNNILQDAVGMCPSIVGTPAPPLPSQAFFEGTPLATFPGGNPISSYQRKLDVSNSCIDANNNASDFFLRDQNDPQNFASPLTTCGNPTPTPTFTSSPTFTFTPSPTTTPCPTSSLSLLINEVGWMGTVSSSSDEWVELYNPGACDINLTGWNLAGTNYYYSSGNFTPIALTGTITAGGYFVIAQNSQVFQNLTPNQIASSLSLPNSYQSLRLTNPAQTLVDTANYAGSYYWPAGTTSPNYASMERRGQVSDGPTAWVTYAGPTGPTSTNVKDRNGNYVHGTPGGPNWAATVTITPSPVPTATTKPRVPTPIPPTPFAHVVINEFLPRAGFDWNNDGVVDVNDEFIEIENLGPINANLSGWRLSDDPNIGGKTFALPSQTLKPGQRAVFYGSTTHILLVDSGDTIRLTNPSGVIVDARGYGVVKYPDQSHCRIPDGNGYWQLVCFPTPGNENMLTGVIPASPPAKIDQPAPCLLPDTTPLEFRLAICNPFGADIWNRKYWDSAAGQNKFVIPDPFGKGEIIVE